jgi:formylglycine-generating enzyme required for sulfatase activity
MRTIAYTLALVGLLACAVHAVAPTVTNVQAVQMQDSARKVKITYTLTDPDSSNVYVSLSISNDNGATYNITPSLATGDIGWVRTGGSRTIYWDAKSQYPTAQWSNCKAKITADDSSGGVYPGQMIYIPAGSFLMGNNGSEPYSFSDELPQHSVYLSGYWIGKYEVTRGEYAQFMAAGGYSNQAYWSSAGWSWRLTASSSYPSVGPPRTQPSYWAASQNWGTGTFTQTDSHPVVGVSYHEAEAFCNWAGGHLPTEAQWERAARWTGSYPNVYPWGNTWDAEKCNNLYDSLYPRCQSTPVGAYSSGASPYGCMDMVGNVWDWCQEWYKSYPGSSSPFDYTNSLRAQRGGSWKYPNLDCRCANRSCDYPSVHWYDIGFRLAR